MVVVGTEYGNLEAMLRFQRQALAGDKTISAQQFPHATTSSASTFINMSKNVTGGNVTLNAGTFTSITALLHTFLHLQSNPTGGGHLFVGDTYCEEAMDDVIKRTCLSRRITPGVCYAWLTGGGHFNAEIAFGDRSFELCGTEHSRIYRESEPSEQNGAFALHWLMSSAITLVQGESVSLGIEVADRRAAISITRQLAA